MTKLKNARKTAKPKTHKTRRSKRMAGFLKNYVYELAALFLLTVAIVFAWNMAFTPQTDADLVSLELNFAQFLFVFLPLVIAAAGGWLAHRRSDRLSQGLALSATVLVTYTLVALFDLFLRFFTLPEEAWAMQYDEVALNTGMSTGVAGFKLIFLLELLKEGFRELAAVFGFAVVGTLIGWKLHAKYGKK